MAPVSKFYAPFADVLARSFEGLNKSDSYNKFQRTNIRLAKANGWFLDKYSPFTPLPYQLSGGSLMPLSYRLEITSSYSRAYVTIDNLDEYDSNVGMVSSKLVANGYKVGDVVTLIVVFKSDNGTYTPAYTQFAVDTLSSVTLANLQIPGTYFEAGPGALVIENASDDICAFAAIISRHTNRGWLRSTQFLAVDPAIVTQLTSETQRASAIASYGPQNSGGGGGVYPGGDGEVFNVAAASGRALLFYGGIYDCTILHNLSYRMVKLKPTNVDTYFFIRRGTTDFLQTNTNDSTSPADWSFASGIAGTISDDVTIYAPEGSEMARYLASIGVSL